MSPPVSAANESGDVREGLFEAVLGANAARRLGLRIGDRFVATHGVGRGIAENTHESQYTVVGILAPTASAYDSAVFTHYESVWQAHRPDVLAMRPFALTSAEPIILEQVTAVLISAVGFIEQNQIVQQYYIDPILQAAFPGAELVNLISLLNQGQQILNLIAYLVLGIAGLTLFLSMYGAIQARQQAIAIMRSVGGSRQNIFRVVIFETLLVSVAGALLGRLLGYGLALVIASVYGDRVSVPLPVRYLWDFEPILWTLSIGVGILAGLVPAAMAYRVNVVETLFPS